MDRERKAINLNSTILFDRDVKSRELATVIPKYFQGDIIINGELNIEDDFSIQCDNLYVVKVISDSAKRYVEGYFYSIDLFCCD